MSKFITQQFLPFDLLDPASVLKYLAITAFYFLLLRMCSRRVQSNEVDVFLVVNISVAFSLCLVTIYLEKSQIRPSDFVAIIFLTASFYVTVFLTSVALRFEGLKNKVKPLARQALMDDQLCRPVLILSFLALVPAILSIAMMVQTKGEGSSTGILRESGGLRFIGEGLMPFFTYYALSIIAVGGKVRNLPMLIIVFGIGPLIGSKAAIVNVIVDFFVLRGLYSPEMRFKQALRLLPVLPLLLATMLLPLLIFGKSIGPAVVSLGSRFFLSGDMYFWLFVAARPEHFYAYYDWGSYLLHPVIAMFGQRGYDVPLGAALMGHYLNQATLVGPNPLAPGLALVLFKGNLFFSCLYCTLLGILVVAMRYLGLWAFTLTRLPPFLRSLCFIVFFFDAPLLFIDIGTTQRLMLSTLVFGILFIFLGLMGDGVRMRLKGLSALVRPPEKSGLP